MGRGRRCTYAGVGAIVLLAAIAFGTNAQADKQGRADGAPAIAFGTNAQADKQGRADGAPLQQTTASRSTAGTLGIGDKLKLSFFERLEIEEDKWANRKKSGKPDQSFVQRSEISGEYVIQEDGTILVPLLGTFAVANKTTTDLDAELTKTFFEAVGRPGFVSIVLIERPPIYVIGPVKQPGVYKYEPGLTVLHAIALAGGMGRGQVDSWTLVEAAREAGRLDSSSRRLKRLLAEVAVLVAERDGSVPKPSSRLVDLAGGQDADALLAQQKERRSAIVSAREERHKSLMLATEAARRAVDLAHQRIEPIQGSIDMKKSRVGALEGLKGQGHLERTVLAMAHSEVADVEDRKLVAQSAWAEAELRLALAEIEEKKFSTDVRIELDREIAARERDIEEAVAGLSMGNGVLDVLRVGPGSPAGSDAALSFEIVRRTQRGSEVIPAEGTTQLRSGDLVRIRSSRADETTPIVR
jgi:protein involved in polysaccharide export with SLBB domain